MEYLDKTQVIVDDIVKMVKQISKAKTVDEISTLEVKCVKAIQIAQMQFGYVTRDLQAAVRARREELRDASRARVEKALADLNKVLEETEPKAEAPKKKKAAKKSTKKGE